MVNSAIGCYNGHKRERDGVSTMNVIEIIIDRANHLLRIGREPVVILVSPRTANLIKSNARAPPDKSLPKKLYDMKIKVIKEIEGHFILVLPKLPASHLLDELYSSSLEKAVLEVNLGGE